MLKNAISGQGVVVKSTMDISGDGVVNSRDLIELLRIVRLKSAAGAAGGAPSAKIDAIRAERDQSRPSPSTAR